MKRKFLKVYQKTCKVMASPLAKCMMLMLVMLVIGDYVYAKTGASALEKAVSSNITPYWSPIKTVIRVIGGFVALFGGTRVYNKWTNGDQDVQKSMVSWAGAIIFILLIPSLMESLFGLS